MNQAVSLTKPSFIDAFSYSIKKSSSFTCIGWISQPIIPDTDSLILLAVADLSGVVLGSDAAIKFELLADAGDYRLQFSNALSKKIDQAVSVRLDDGNWHFLSYVCAGEGVMSFYVDGLLVPAEDGTNPEGPPYYTAWAREVRQGGGDVWCPYLYKAGQAISVYSWRFAKDIQIHQQWVQELMERDIPALIV